MYYDTSFKEFAELNLSWFRISRPKSNKRDAPLISPAMYHPHDRRSNDNVLGHGSWYALDIDHLKASFEEIQEYFDALNINYILHTTTSHSDQEAHLRLLGELDRNTLREELPLLWSGLYEYFGQISDPQTKDFSRMYTVPANWEDTNPKFAYQTSRYFLEVDEIIKLAPPIVSPQPILIKNLKNVQNALDGAGKIIPVNDSIQNSKIVNSKMISQYLSLPKGEHHSGLYRFMCHASFSAISKGYDIDVYQLVDYAKQLDMICPIKTAKDRWKDKIFEEALRALTFTISNYKEQINE